jgi:hypothetical protein
VIQDERDLAKERARLYRMVDRFVAAGPKGCTTHPHSDAGGVGDPEYQHLDHHLRQFGV